MYADWYSIDGTCVSVFLVDIMRPLQPDSPTNVVSRRQFVRYALAGVHKRKLTENDPVKLQTTQTHNECFMI
jgi:hypothetical protein